MMTVRVLVCEPQLIQFRSANLDLSILWMYLWRCEACRTTHDARHDSAIRQETQTRRLESMVGEAPQAGQVAASSESSALRSSKLK